MSGVKKPFAEKFFRKVEFDTVGGCWLWTGAINKWGYGKIGAWDEGSQRFITIGAHREAYTHLVGPIPEGHEIDHLCRVRCCVNPAHLEPVTRRENLLRGNTVAARNAAVTHCPNGHPYDSENTFPRLGGRGRGCRACRKDQRLLICQSA